MVQLLFEGHFDLRALRRAKRHAAAADRSPCVRFAQLHRIQRGCAAAHRRFGAIGRQRAAVRQVADAAGDRARRKGGVGAVAPPVANALALALCESGEPAFPCRANATAAANVPPIKPVSNNVRIGKSIHDVKGRPD
jgi:hypothetical protein